MSSKFEFEDRGNLIFELHEFCFVFFNVLSHCSELCWLYCELTGGRCEMMTGTWSHEPAAVTRLSNKVRHSSPYTDCISYNRAISNFPTVQASPSLLYRPSNQDDENDEETSY